MLCVKKGLSFLSQVIYIYLLLFVCRMDAALQLQLTVLTSLIHSFIDFDKLMGGNIEVAWQGILGLAYPFMKTMSLAHQLQALVGRCLANRNKYSDLMHFVEYAAGVGNLTRSCLRAGLRGCCFDYIYTEAHNVLTSAGLRLWLDAQTALIKKGMAWFGTQCSSFTSLCLSVSLRGPENEYQGDTTRSFVVEGNSLLEITALQFFLGWLLGQLCVLEQPLGSCMPLLKSMRHVLHFTRSSKLVTYAGAFGARSVKPLQIWVTSSIALNNLVRERPAMCDEQLASRDTSGGYTGKPLDLYESQAYTGLFGTCVAGCLVEHLQSTG